MINFSRCAELFARMAAFAFAAGPVCAAVHLVGIRDGSANGTPAFTAVAPAQALTDSFCIISTVGSVKLTFVNAGGVDPATRSWRAHNAQGEFIRYRQYAAMAGDAIATLVSDAASPGLVIPIARAARSAEGCGSGNISKGIVPVDPIPNRQVYQDQVTISVTPL